MSETRPVVFGRDDDNDKVPKSVQKARDSAQGKQDGFKVKHRKKARHTVVGHEDESITEITINQLNEHEDLRLRDFSVDDYVKHRIKNSQKSVGNSIASEQDMSMNRDISNPVSARSGLSDFTDDSMSRCLSKTSLPDSHSSIESPHLRSKPTSPMYGSKLNSADFVITPGKTLIESPYKSSSSSRIGSDKSSNRDRGSAKSNRPAPAKPLHMTYNTSNSFNQYGTKGDTEFIKITAQIRNPNYMSSNMCTKDPYISQCGTDEAIRQVVKQNTPDNQELEEELDEEVHQQVPAPSPDIPEPDPEALPVDDNNLSLGTTSPSPAISIPTAEDFHDKDDKDFNDKESLNNSPWASHRGVNGEDVLDAHSKREAAFRDSQIDQITSLLKGAIVDPNGDSAQREGSASVTKTVTFQV